MLWFDRKFEVILDKFFIG